MGYTSVRQIPEEPSVPVMETPFRKTEPALNGQHSLMFRNGKHLLGMKLPPSPRVDWGALKRSKEEILLPRIVFTHNGEICLGRAESWVQSPEIPKGSVPSFEKV